MMVFLAFWPYFWRVLAGFRVVSGVFCPFFKSFGSFWGLFAQFQDVFLPFSCILRSEILVKPQNPFGKQEE
jgi:hypothetical protein